MADLCDTATEKVSETGRVVTPNARARVAQLDPDTQVKWVANPGMESIMQRVENEWIAALRHDARVPSTTLEAHVEPSKPVVAKKPEPEPEEEVDFIGGIFD